MGRARETKLLLFTTTICLLSEAKRRKRRSCWATNYSRRQQHNISNLIREVQCEDEAEFRGIFGMDIASLESLLE